VFRDNLGVFLIKQGKYSEAVRKFASLDFSNATSAERCLWTYNFGRALEGSGTLKEAYAKYKSAMTQEPKFDAAAEGAFRVLREGKLSSFVSDGIAEATEIGQLLLDRGRTEVAGREVRKCMEAWSSDPQSRKLLEVLVRYYATSSIGPSQFGRTEWEFLKSLKTDSSIHQAIDELRVAYDCDFKPTFARGEEVFPAWSKSTAFSHLLKSIGDFYDQQRDRKKALERYSLAVAIDIHNSEACLYAASLLREDRAEIDPDRSLLNQLIDIIFSAKGEAYYEVSGEPASWEDILRFHIVLATIFENEGAWDRQWDPRSAVFQWEHAAHAEEQARKHRPNMPPSPGINLGLAHAYDHIGRLPQALDEYLTAARGFVETSRRREALDALNRAGVNDRLKLTHF
jgi:tetratricopeptide (TPR) repeat protein